MPVTIGPVLTVQTDEKSCTELQDPPLAAYGGSNTDSRVDQLWEQFVALFEDEQHSEIDFPGQDPEETLRNHMEALIEDLNVPTGLSIDPQGAYMAQSRREGTTVKWNESGIGPAAQFPLEVDSPVGGVCRYWLGFQAVGT